MRALHREGWSRAYVDGGRLVQSFISEGLIEDLALTIVPILIGTGIRPFGEIGRDIDLELTGTTTFPSGLVQVRYRVLVSGT
jgi:dihydrofolate reductase